MIDGLDNFPSLPEERSLSERVTDLEATAQKLADVLRQLESLVAEERIERIQAAPVAPDPTETLSPRPLRIGVLGGPIPDILSMLQTLPTPPESGRLLEVLKAPDPVLMVHLQLPNWLQPDQPHLLQLTFGPGLSFSID